VSFVVDFITGFTCLDNRLYVVYYLHSTIHVFTADTFSEVTVITVNGLEYPTYIIASHDDNQLYVSDVFSVWRVSAVNPTNYELWLTVGLPHGFFSLSLTSRRLLLTYRLSHTLRQYSTVNKELLRVIDLPDPVKRPTYAVETSRDTFVVSHLEPHRGVSELFSKFHYLVVTFT